MPQLTASRLKVKEHLLVESPQNRRPLLIEGCNTKLWQECSNTTRIGTVITEDGSRFFFFLTKTERTEERHTSPLGTQNGAFS